MPNFAANLLNFTPFLKLLVVKNLKNEYFDQRLGCAASKHWSKYTAEDVNVTLFSSIFKIICIGRLNGFSGPEQTAG